MGYSEDFLRMLARRNVDKVAFHLLPLLKPGMRVLDFGCGPGTISVGLAKRVEPGELHGIDIAESQIEMAREAAKAGGHDNATFRVASVGDLPFEDGFFDAAHGHAILMHVSQLDEGLAELKRVLKPGGTLSLRELVANSNMYEPDPDGRLRQATGVFSSLLTANGGHPQLGNGLKRLLLEAGFEDVRATASFELFSDDEDRAFFQGFLSGWFLGPQMKDPALRYGFATEADVEAWAETLKTWRAHPGGFAAFAWGEAVARKPEVAR